MVTFKRFTGLKICMLQGEEGGYLDIPIVSTL